MGIDEYTLFEITGLVFWVSVDVTVSIFILLVAVYIPVRAATYWKKILWDWMWAARIADTGYTQDDLVYAYRLHGSPLKGKIELDDLIRWLAQVKERAAKQARKSAASR